MIDLFRTLKKNKIKKLSNSERLALLQVIAAIMIIIFTTLRLPLNDYVNGGLALITASILLFSGIKRNTKKITLYEQTLNYIFNEVETSFDSFVDYIMSKRENVHTNKAFEDEIIKKARYGSRETKRKLARSLHFFNMMDKELTKEIIRILREDIIDKTNTDIRRRTVESLLSIIQMQDSFKKRRRYARYFLNYFNYYFKDEIYTGIACIEALFYCYKYVFSKNSLKQKVKKRYEKLVIDYSIQNNNPEESMSLKKVWDILETMSDVSHSSEKLTYIEDRSINGTDIEKLVIVKNLFYLCPNFPNCITDECVNSPYWTIIASMLRRYMQDDNRYLSMPTVRYFDCLCRLLKYEDCREEALVIIRHYFNTDNIIILRTVFDKILLLKDYAGKYADNILNELVNNLNTILEESINNIKRAMDKYPRAYKFFELYDGRKKVRKINVCSDDDFELANDENLANICNRIKKHTDYLKFMGYVKSHIR